MSDVYYDALKEAGESFVTLPDSYKHYVDLAKDHLKRREATKNKDLAERFNDRFSGMEESGFKVNVYLRGESNPNQPPLKTIKLKDGTTAQLQEAAICWFTQKSNKPNEGNAFCYKMDTEGNWYKQKATSYTHNSETNTNIWKLGAAERIDDPNEVQFLVDSRVQNLPTINAPAA